jgi:hypothetical protein
VLEDRDEENDPLLGLRVKKHFGDKYYWGWVAGFFGATGYLVVYDDKDREDYDDDDSNRGGDLRELRRLVENATRGGQGLRSPGWRVRNRISTSGAPTGFPVVVYRCRNITRTVMYPSRQAAIDAGAIDGGDTDDEDEGGEEVDGAVEKEREEEEEEGEAEFEEEVRVPTKKDKGGR